MPWYYAGPEAKPIGPISLEELHARRISGAISAGTYVIEHTGQPNEARAWKRYQEIFPANPGMVLSPLPFFPPAPPLPSQPTLPPNPLFPSAAHASVPLLPQPAAGATVGPHYSGPVRTTNVWCAWGFGLGLASFALSFACGIGLLAALPSIFLCIYGLSQMHKHPDQTGRGLAIAGLVFSVLTLLVAFMFVLALAIPTLKAHGLTVTEQTSNDSQ